MTFIRLNPNYVMKPDTDKVLVMAALNGRNVVEDDTFTDVIHPLYAMILSFVNGDDVDSCVLRASEYLNVSPNLVKNFIESLLDNPNQIVFKSKEGNSFFPPRMIVSCEERFIDNRYAPEAFHYENAKLCLTRYKEPSSLTLMVNNICVTDCVYCYEDKSKKVDCSIPLQRIFELIHEAQKLHVVSFDVIGGEFFLYKYWKEVLGELRKCGYQPYLSSKMCVDEEIVRTLKSLDILDIQMSVDSFVEEHVRPLLRVKSGYVERMKQSLRLLEKYGIPVRVHSVLTRFNSSVQDMQSLYEYLKTLKNVTDWKIVVGDSTLYPRMEYSEMVISEIALSEQVDYLNSISSESPFPVHAPSKDYLKDSMSSVDMAIRKKSFFSRAFCSGLFSSLYILPDGNVTICEQLYWHPHFIVGNVKQQSIEEIWNSEKAKSLYYIKQSDIPEDSLCHDCKDFHVCRNLRQLCYRDVVKKYGAEKWYYPDSNCPYV